MVRDGDIDYLKKYLSSDRLDDGIQLLEKGISPQYIVGNVNFYGYNMKVNSSVLIPRFETELLVEKTISFVKERFHSEDRLSCLDIGTGSGCIAITLKKEFCCDVVGCDVSDKALDVARENASLNDVDISFVSSDIYSNITGKFDVIISNPPYIRFDEEIEDIVRNNEPSIALYAKDNGLYFYRKILEGAKNYLNHKFIIAFEIGELQGNDVRKLAYYYLNDIDVVIEKDYAGRERFVFIFSK